MNDNYFDGTMKGAIAGVFFGLGRVVAGLGAVLVAIFPTLFGLGVLFAVVYFAVKAAEGG